MVGTGRTAETEKSGLQDASLSCRTTISVPYYMSCNLYLGHTCRSDSNLLANKGTKSLHILVGARSCNEAEER